MKRSKSSNYWLKEHFSDIYVKRAKKEGFRARSVYKLMEIQSKYKILRPNMYVVDLGAAPGSWSDYIVKLVGFRDNVIALDILPMRPIQGVEFIQGDFTQNDVIQNLLLRLKGRDVDVILSDMAPNLSGLNVVDQARSMDLAVKCLFFAKKVLKQGGVFLIKTFQGADFDAFLKTLRHNFSEVKGIKPEASRARSSEIYLLARGFQRF